MKLVGPKIVGTIWARQAPAKIVVDEERMRKQREHFVELLFKSAEKQLL